MMDSEANRRTAGICREVEPIDVTQFTSMPPSGSTFFPNPHAKKDLPCAFETLEAFDNEGPIPCQCGIKSDGTFRWKSE
jgi:hypothetical protein